MMYCTFNRRDHQFTARPMAPEDIPAACHLLAKTTFKDWATPSMLAMQLSRVDVQGIVLSAPDGLEGEPMLGLMLFQVGQRYREIRVFGVEPGERGLGYASALIDLLKRLAVDHDLRIGVAPDLTDPEIIQALRDRGFHDPSRDWPARHECLLMFNPEWHNDANRWVWTITPQSPVYEGAQRHAGQAVAG